MSSQTSPRPSRVRLPGQNVYVSNSDVYSLENAAPLPLTEKRTSQEKTAKTKQEYSWEGGGLSPPKNVLLQHRRSRRMKWTLFQCCTFIWNPTFCPLAEIISFVSFIQGYGQRGHVRSVQNEEESLIIFRKWSCGNNSFFFFFGVGKLVSYDPSTFVPFAHL